MLWFRAEARKAILIRDMNQRPRKKTHAYKRIFEETVTGATLIYPDGTIIVDGKIVTVGPRAIIRDGEVVGMLSDGHADNVDQSSG